MPSSSVRPAQRADVRPDRPTPEPPAAPASTNGASGTRDDSPHQETHQETRQAGPSGPGSWDLVRAAQDGDRAAFAVLYDRYVDVVFRYVLFRVGSRELAEDVTSETFLRALRRITSVHEQGRDVGAWFVTIARNLVLDHVKSSRFRLEVPAAEIDDTHCVGTGVGTGIGTRGDTGAGAGPEQQVLSGVTRSALLDCVGRLGADQRECIVLRFLQGLSVAETAQVMGRNDGAIKALQHRAVRRLAQLLPSELR